MIDLIRKTVLAGVGFAALTKEKAEEIIHELTKAGNISEEEGRKAVEELMEKSEKARKDFEKQVEKLVTSAMEKLDIPTRKDYEKLKRDISKVKLDIKKLQSE